MHPAEVVDMLDYRTRKQERRDSDHISTGSLSLDLALGSGWRKGRIAELYGDYSTYKTSLARHAVAEAQKDGTVLWIDPAGEYDTVAAQAVGINPRELAISRPDSALQALQIIKDVAGFFSLIVIDGAQHLSIDSLADYDQELGWVKSELSTTAVLFTSGGQVLSPFVWQARKWSSQRVKLTPRDRGEIRGTVVKNASMMPPVHTVRMQFLKDATLDHVWELVVLAIELGVIEARGSWYYHEGRNIGQGVDGAMIGICGLGRAGWLREQVVAACS